MKKKLLYVLPEYDANAPTHHVPIFELLEEMGKEMDIFLVIEEAVGRPLIKNLRFIYPQRIRLPVFNLAERWLVILGAGLLGYRTIYVHYSYWAAILGSFVRLFGGRVFYWHCEVYDKFFSDFSWSIEAIKKKLLDEWLMVVTLKVVDYLVTGTKSVGKFYVKQFPMAHSKVKIVPNWVNVERFRIKTTKDLLARRLGLPKNRQIVLFAHRLVPRKGADFLPVIIDMVSHKRKRVFFVVAGDGPMREELGKKLCEKSRAKFVRMVGAIPNVAMAEYLGAADLFIMPSRQEGFPRVLVEAMAAGVPFVASDVGGTRDILTKGQQKFLVGKGETANFSKKVIEILSHKKVRESLVRVGQNSVRQNYSLAVVAKKFTRLLS